ncbi:MAG: beta-ketoacyl synthase [Chitinophagales bacterium]|nr:beta-ketoacyl synthase [Chitinophagales bacterium]
MNRVFAVADNIFSPLGATTAENFRQVMAGNSGIRAVNNSNLSPEVFYASLFNELPEDALHTRFEKICIASIADALKNSGISLSSPDTVFILSTTKGNIELIESNEMSEELRQRVSLFNTAKKITAHFNAANKPLVVSNACISGVLAVLIAKRLLQSGAYRHAVVTGADVLSRFIISGFQSLHAMSSDVCKPFDKSRNGINLGECAATMVLTAEQKNAVIEIGGGASSNDANHISGPSRTGHELAYAVSSALKESNVSATDLSFISAHGTATLYNDEMEAKAFAYSGLAKVPLHSLKGHYGHTLGAAGVVESIITYHSLLQQVVLPSKNFSEHGVSEKVNVSNVLQKSDKHHALKTASGFGGCNAAILYSTT